MDRLLSAIAWICLPMAVALAVRATYTGSTPPTAPNASRSFSISESESRRIITCSYAARAGDEASARYDDGSGALSARSHLQLLPVQPPAMDPPCPLCAGDLVSLYSLDNAVLSPQH